MNISELVDLEPRMFNAFSSPLYHYIYIYHTYVVKYIYNLRLKIVDWKSISSNINFFIVS